METRETLAKAFGNHGQERTPQESSTENPQNEELGPAARDRFERAKRREEKEKLCQLVYEAYRTQSGLEVTAPIKTVGKDLEEMAIKKAAEQRAEFKPQETAGERFRRLTQEKKS